MTIFLHNKLLFKISIIKVLEIFLPIPLGWITIGKGKGKRKGKGKGKGKKREGGRGREEREERSRIGRKKGRKEGKEVSLKILDLREQQSQACLGNT